jgi:serine/threonine protein kinase
LAHGLKVLHDRAQVVHGDIKPDNVVVSSDSGRFVFIDFGSAWKVEQTVLRNPGDGVSAVYSAPELQSAARFADFRADHFSLSVILYELLTFEIPYGQLGGKAGRADLAHPRLKPPSDLKSDRSRLPTVVWNAIDRLLLRSLALDPDRRYPTPEAWLDEFDSIDLDIRRPPTLTPLNDRLTRIVSWLLQSFADKEATSP